MEYYIANALGFSPLYVAAFEAVATIFILLVVVAAYGFATLNNKGA